MKLWNRSRPATSTQSLRPAGSPPRRRWLRILMWFGIVCGAGLVLLASTVAFVFWMYGRDPDLPDISSLADYHPKQVIKIYDANDRLVGELLGPDKNKERRTYLPYDKIPPMVVDAFVAAEDNRFWEHSGIDYWGMFRALVTAVRSGGSKKHGASTITQQVVKTFLLTPEKTFKRKVQEIILARRVEKRLSKEEIITLYMNQINFGNARYGVQEAARFYFGKDVTQINVGEAALLAAVVQRPEGLAPNQAKNQRDAKGRQVYVLNQLVEMGKLAPAEAKKWIEAPIQIVEKPFPYLGTAPEWVDLVRDELVELLKAQGKDESALDTLGGSVRTTLDPAIQQAAQAALQKGLRAVDERKRTGRRKREVKPEKIKAELAALAKKLGKGPAAREVYEAIVTAVHDEDNELEVDLGNYPAAVILGGDDDARFNPPGEGAKPPSARFKPGDVIDVTVAPGGAGAPKPKHAAKRVALAPGPEGAVVVIELKSRKVRALVGGFSAKRGEFNRATMALRQPGSAFKPFVFAAAIEAKKATAGGHPGGGAYLDTPEAFELWRPKNYDSKFEGPMLARPALAKSINTIAIKITYDVTPAAVADLAEKMGITHKLPREMALSLGAGEVTPLEMTNALATLGAGGIAAKPKFIEAINGQATPPVAGEQVISPQAAYIVTDMMRSVVTSGTGHLAQALKVPVAGKTGTSNDAKDTWFVGMTPDYVIGVWVGFDDPRSMGRETGGSVAVPVFVELGKQMNLPAKQFTRPPGILDVQIDRATGDLAPDGAPKSTVTTELFLEGTQPTQYAAKPGEITDQNLHTSEFEEE